jgi:GNAT superfamily N-acetyltransferase
MTQPSTVPQFVIRPATTADVPTILALIRELADYERLSDEVVATEKDLQQWLFGDRPVAEVVIGEHRGITVSYALFFYNFSTFLGKPGLYLEDLYVKPAYRDRGFGRKLLAHIARLAKTRNCSRFEWAVLNWNTPAIDLYEKLGAVPNKEWTVYRLSGEALNRLAGQRRPGP